MSQENVEIVRRAFAAFEEGDVSQMLDLATDDLITYRADPDRAEYHGKEGFFEVTADWIEGFRDWSVTAEEFMDAGERVVSYRRTKPPTEKAAASPSRATSGSSSKYAGERSRS